ncbi:trafficking kinesin-binding protein milt isoform X1 [Acyrthosiphon pisum]|uniref:Trafficking kinesin-binding protein 1 n=2 Tax=Acyrthosiphon pisum TaxID=7029 RepID=A0A8R2JV61_ACYPI|nr:trafficking kinesin-binding protein milt isoform X1 [Acyrthosiphon pisum]|eukprot:XP_008181974.1 PREDICTED: trafficking kinesin-binding protein milt isoform X1 [Acyrthosiphon pisum]
MFPCPEDRVCRPQFKNKGNRFDQRQQDILNTWQSEICSNDELPEVELISLLEETIPQYKLRADTLTQFTGYENKDWYIPSPASNEDEVDTASLSKEYIRETLNYFLLCSNRVSQMTKTYNDIEAVTQLLAEKEKDLELTARIGKELLTGNQTLEARVGLLETELKTVNERYTQASYELQKKNDLIKILSNDADETGYEANDDAVENEKYYGVSVGYLQSRLKNLEDENRSLRGEANRLAMETDEVEAKEAQLMSDFASQLSVTRSDLSVIMEQADKHRDENVTLHNNCEFLRSKLSSVETSLKIKNDENEELMAMLMLARDTQNELASEIVEVKKQYEEVLTMLHECQTELKGYRDKHIPLARAGPLFTSLPPYLNSNGLHSHGHSSLESSLFSELSLDSGICTGRMSGASSYKKSIGMMKLTSAMETSTRNLSRQTAYNDLTEESPTHSDCDDFSDTDSFIIEQPGIPGAPGSEDLANALKRLTPASIKARRAALGSGFMFADPYDSADTRTPDSIMSTGSISLTTWKTPNKLQLVKPMQGSFTLQQWNAQSVPSLSSILEEQPQGVIKKSDSTAPIAGLPQTFRLDEIEEDEPRTHPGKMFQMSTHITTITNSRVMHPDDGTSVTTSVRASAMSSVVNSCVNSRVPTRETTPMLSRRNSTTTFSTNCGLAAMLNERGIRAITPSALATPMFSTTATPCNSPYGSPGGSPDRSRSPSPSDSPYSHPFGLPGYLMHSGAKLLRKTLTGTERGTEHHKSRKSKSLIRPDKKTLAGIRLVETMKHYIPTVPPDMSGHPVFDIGDCVPPKPENGALQRRLKQLDSGNDSGGPRLRMDLGTVGSSANDPQPSRGTLISSMFFARKGGLL